MIMKGWVKIGITRTFITKFQLVTSNVATPLWGKCEDETYIPKSGNFVTPLWGKCEDETHSPKSGNLEFSGLPKL